jgi:uncharacterized protein (TIGR03790 family)
MMSYSAARGRFFAWPGLLLFCLGLGPQQIALIVNSNVPEGLTLARQYVSARGIPDGRIISMDLPAGEEIEFDQYERYVVPFLRDWLHQHQLNNQVRCLVTFYGVPFRIRDRVDTGAEKQELADLRGRLGTVLDQATPLVQRLESMAHDLDPAFRPPPLSLNESANQSLVRRYDAALRAAGLRIQATTQPAARAQYFIEFLALMSKLGGDADLVDHAAPANLNAAGEAGRRWQDLRRLVIQAIGDLNIYEQKRYDPDARAAVLKITAQHFGLIRLGGVLESQIDYLTPGNTNAAFDSELSLLWLNYYPRNGAWINPLYYNALSPVRAQTLMVSRLDGPDVPTVSRMIQTSVDVERRGLRGGLVVNSFGYPHNLSPDGRNMYKLFDLKFRALADLVQSHGNIPVHTEYTRLLSHREMTDTALYCGWYSLRRYIPGMTFAPGAVGYHVASLEMVGLHEPYETGWVRGLLSDGVVATLGPVAEPYMDAFPTPNEFFPLLMTGKLTLAEVYWRTQLTASWMMCLLGDPLYTPYRLDPVLKPEDLPIPLRRVIARAMAPANSSSRP